MSLKQQRTSHSTPTLNPHEHGERKNRVKISRLENFVSINVPIYAYLFVVRF